EFGSEFRVLNCALKSRLNDGAHGAPIPMFLKRVAKFQRDRRAAGSGIGCGAIAFDARVFEAGANVLAHIAQPGDGHGVAVLAAEIRIRLLVVASGKSIDTGSPAIGPALLR